MGDRAKSGSECDAFCERSLFIWAKIIRYVFDAGIGVSVGNRESRRFSARQTASPSPSLSLNEQVHRELRRVEAAATTDNEPTEEGREDIQSPERATAPPAAVRTLRTSAFSVNPSVRALRTRDLKFYA